MTAEEKLIESIRRILAQLDESRLKNVYQFVLHISK